MSLRLGKLEANKREDHNLHAGLYSLPEYPLKLVSIALVVALAGTRLKTALKGATLFAICTMYSEVL
jgi:hypothetical protein